MKWCCVLFESEYNTAGNRGSSIIVGRDYFGKPEFIVQHRSADRSVEQVPDTDYPMAWVSEMRIFFCPWCGRKLDKWYRKEIDNLYRPSLKIPDIKVTES